MKKFNFGAFFGSMCFCGLASHSNINYLLFSLLLSLITGFILSEKYRKTLSLLAYSITMIINIIIDLYLHQLTLFHFAETFYIALIVGFLYRKRDSN